MSCILRIAGKDLKLKDLLKIELTPDSTWEKGSPKFSRRPDGKKNTTSGARYVVSDAGFDAFEQQKLDALKFLERYKKQIKEILSLPNIEGACLDFGIYWRDVPVQCDNFPSNLVKLAGRLDLELELTQYLPDEEDENRSEPSSSPDC